MKDYEKAEADFARSPQLNPHDGEAYTKPGGTRMNFGDADCTIAEAKQRLSR